MLLAKGMPVRPLTADLAFGTTAFEVPLSQSGFKASWQLTVRPLEADTLTYGLRARFQNRSARGNGETPSSCPSAKALADSTLHNSNTIDLAIGKVMLHSLFHRHSSRAPCL
eukprot:2776482-Amphidinium_carterae.1